MKITDIEAIPFRLPLRRELLWAGLKVELGAFVLVRMHTDSNHVGIGEATPLPDWGGDHHIHGGETTDTVCHMVRDVMAPALAGLDPLAYEATRCSLDSIVKGNSYAKAAIDMALLDLAGKACGLPIHRLLGGPHRPEVPVAHMVGIMPFDDAISEAEAAVADGVRALQVKGGVDPQRDVQLIMELRNRLGPGIHLRLDANQGYQRSKRAVRHLRDLPPGALDLLEQPVEGLEEMSRATRNLEIDVMADETCWSPHDALQVIAAGAADAISVYVAKAGGISAARLVGAIAHAAGLPTDINGSIESGVGNAANVQTALATLSCSLSCVIPISAPAGTHPYAVAGRYYDDDIITEPFPVRNGSLLPLDSPGLGVVVDEDKLSRYRTDGA